MASTVRGRVGDLDITVETPPGVRTERTSRVSPEAEGVLDAFAAQAREAIVEITASTAVVVDRTTVRSVRLDHLEMTFGLHVSAHGNFIVAKAEGAAFEVKAAPGATSRPER